MLFFRYILQLAVADTMVLASFPFKIAAVNKGSWFYPDWMCKSTNAVLFLNLYSSVFFLMVCKEDCNYGTCDEMY